MTAKPHITLRNRVQAETMLMEAKGWSLADVDAIAYRAVQMRPDAHLAPTSELVSIMGFALGSFAPSTTEG